MVSYSGKFRLSYLLLPMVLASVSSIAITAHAQDSLPNIEIHLDAIDDDKPATPVNQRKPINTGKIVLPEGAPFATESSGPPPKKIAKPKKKKVKKPAVLASPDTTKEPKSNDKVDKAFVPIAAPSASDFTSDKTSSGDSDKHKNKSSEKPQDGSSSKTESSPRSNESTIQIPEPLKSPDLQNHDKSVEPAKPVTKEPDVSPVDKEEVKKGLAPIPELKNVSEVPPAPIPEAEPNLPPSTTNKEIPVGVPTPPVADFAKALNEPAPSETTPANVDIAIPKASVKPNIVTTPPVVPDAAPPIPKPEPLPEPPPAVDNAPTPPETVVKDKPVEQPKPTDLKEPTVPVSAKEAPANVDKDKKVDSSKTQSSGASAGKPEMSIEFLSTETTIPVSVEPELKKLAGKIKNSGGRVSLIAYASSQSDQTTMAKRVSFARALAVRAFLIENDIDKSTINVQAEGTKDDGGKPDRVDIFLIEKSN